MRFQNEAEAITYVFKSIAATDWKHRGLDEHTRDTTPTRRLLEAHDLLGNRREYAIVTGSKGKGSVTAITAKLLQSLGHKVGMITSPHLSTYRQRFRINGKMISEDDLVRLIDHLAPTIDAIHATLSAGHYISPQGIFLALALQWFDENQVTAAVIEVGRGGRYDDNAVVPNMLSLFTPILLEHTRYLGPTLDRIAWHKAGVIKPQSYAYSLPQAPEVMDILRAESDHQNAEFSWIAPTDIGEHLESTQDGMRVDFGRYGVVNFPMLGRFEIDNASLAIWGAGNMHARLPLDPPLPHRSLEYVDRIRAGLESVVWPGRCQQLQEQPAVFIDGAINTLSARLFVESVQHLITHPLVTVLAVPTDRDVEGVYRIFAPISDSLVLTETARNVTIFFPDEQTALKTARQYHQDVTYQQNVIAALDAAKIKAGKDGTVLMAVAQPAIGDVMQHYGLLYEEI